MSLLIAREKENFIMLLAGSYDGGVAIEKVEGFKTIEACDSAKASLPKEPVGGWVQTVRTYCVKVK